MRELSGKVAVVTGAASGIGRGMAERWCREGMKVVLADVEEEALALVEKELSATGADVLAVRTDVSKADDMDALAQATLDHFGAVHLVCNNAGVGGGGLAQQLTEKDWQWVLGVNLWGVIHGQRVFLPTLIEQNEGHIVNTASVAGLISSPFMSPYCASKFAVVGISECLQKELAMQGSNVGVSVLCPGFVNTKIADSDRNRPAELQRDEAVVDEAGMREMLRQVVAAGMPCEDVAACVADAVKNDRFYILTHPDLKGAIRTRMEDILEGRTPSPTLIL
jgi:NAD(P)-dependent dehydrogenase (short-subunit alcohol dehydrogenase family)